MIVEDNGTGIKNESIIGDGHGMKNMQSRAQLVNGTLEFENTQPGTLTTFKAPLNLNNINT